MSPANPWLDFLTPEDAIPAADELNRELESWCSTSPPDDAEQSTSTAQSGSRLYGFGILPLVPNITVEVVLESIKQVQSLPHLRGVVLGTKGIGKGLDDPAMDPIWEALAASGLVVFVVRSFKSSS